MQAHADYEVVGEAASSAEALSAIQTSSPDLVLLDISMPKGSGFQFIAQLPHPPRVIFVTAHEEHAQEAFEVAAVDYLLKPVSAERLAIALERVRYFFIRQGSNGPPAELVISATNGVVKPVAALDLVWIRAAGSYTTVTLADGSALTVHRSLNEWEHLLHGRHFVRLDRSLLVNTTHINHLEAAGRNRGIVFFKGIAEPLELGRTALSHLKETLPPALVWTKDFDPLR